MLTSGERRVLRLLLASPLEHRSINQVARLCELAPNGAYKILKKFEGEGVLKSISIANIKSYALAFDNPKTRRVAELALSPKTFDGRIRHRAEDFESLKQAALACVLFGSYVAYEAAPNDLDVLFVLDRKDYKKYSKLIKEVREVCPVKIHDVIQTKEDLGVNIKKQQAMLVSAIRNGVVVWGEDVLVRVVEDVCKGKD